MLLSSNSMAPYQLTLLQSVAQELPALLTPSWQQQPQTKKRTPIFPSGTHRSTLAPVDPAEASSLVCMCPPYYFMYLQLPPTRGWLSLSKPSVLSCCRLVPLLHWRQRGLRCRGGLCTGRVAAHAVVWVQHQNSDEHEVYRQNNTLLFGLYLHQY